MEEGITVGEFITEVQMLPNSLSNIGEHPSNIMIVVQALKPLPPSFDSFVTNISGSQDMPSFDDLTSQLELWEARTNNKSKQSDKEALVVQFRKMFRSRRHLQENKQQRFCPKDKQKYCGRCGKWGHWAKDCNKSAPVPPAAPGQSHQINTIEYENQDSYKVSSSEQADNKLEAILNSFMAHNKGKKNEPVSLEEEDDEDAIAMISEIALTVPPPMIGHGYLILKQSSTSQGTQSCWANFDKATTQSWCA